ncbi:MAG: hypothetical protein KJ630_10105 [Proteobacteria bacterium]|nr:hypothetical protein [Pseudomonadota bacterium]
MKDLLLALLFVLLLIPGTVLAAQPTGTKATGVKVTGDKTITAEGYGASKQEALLQAKRAAVEEGIGVVLSSQTEVENFMLKKDKVITQSFGSVRSYTVIKEELKGDTWYVKISAIVSLDSITADLMALKILLISMDKPRTMVLIQEEGGQNAESTVIDYLQGKGFELIDPAQAAALMAKDDPFIKKAIAGDPVAAAKLGAENGAEYVVVGTVTKSVLANEVIEGTGMKSGQASLTLRVVNCSNGRIVATKSATGASVHIADDIAKSQAVTKAATNLMNKKLFEAIVTSFQDTVNNGATYDIVISGVKSYGLQKIAAKVLEDTEGVVSVTKRSFGGGKLELSVLFKGSAESFCDRVDSKAVDETKLVVTNVAGNRVALNLQ